MTYITTAEIAEEEIEETKRLAGILDAAGIPYMNGETADDYRRQKFEEQANLLLLEMETLKARVTKLEEERQG